MGGVQMSDVKLISHLLRRAGFGATRDQLDEFAAKGYESTVDELFDFTKSDSRKNLSDHLIRRYHNEQSGLMGNLSPSTYWLYHMVHTDTPLQEKIALFWHHVFATGYPKLSQGKLLVDQIKMLRSLGTGKFDSLLVALSKDPAMILWLDNHDNHNGAINENYGRELLELFSMGVGNYSEEDIKECSRAFTGWTLSNTEYMLSRAERDSIWPYGRIMPFFEFKSEDHDNGEKEFLGHKGNFNGEDIIKIICQQPATARFIARHMYHFFVADEPPVPSWPYKAARDPEAIELLAEVYFKSNYDIGEMIRFLLKSEFFRDESVWYAKVKSPIDLVVSVLRLSEEVQRPQPYMVTRALQLQWMGQQLNNPPSVEGWHQGTEWIDTGTLVERLNFATDQFGDINKPGIRSITEKIVANGGSSISPERLVEMSLDQMGITWISDDSRAELIKFATSDGEIDATKQLDEKVRTQIANLLQMVASSSEFQRG